MGLIFMWGRFLRRRQKRGKSKNYPNVKISKFTVFESQKDVEILFRKFFKNSSTVHLKTCFKDCEPLIMTINFHPHNLFFQDTQPSLCHLCDYRCKNNHNLKTHIRLKHKVLLTGAEIKQIQAKLQSSAPARSACLDPTRDINSMTPDVNDMAVACMMGVEQNAGGGIVDDNNITVPYIQELQPIL